MSVKVGELHGELKLDKGKFDSDIDGAGKSFGKLGTLAKAAGLLIVGAFAAAGVAAFGMVMGFDSAVDAIRIGTGKTGKELDGLVDDFKAVAKTVPDDLGLVSQTLAELHKRTGATGDGLQALTRQILDMSRITKTDAAANVALSTRLFGDWAIATDDQAAALDRVFRASQATGIGVDQLMAKAVQFGAPLRAMGFSLDETAALLGKWEKEGVNTELVLGSMRIALGKFAKAGIPAREGLDGVIKKIQEMGPSAEATALGMATFGARAGPDMVAAILEGRFAIDDYMAAIANGTDTIASATADTADFPETLGKLVNAVTVEVGSKLMPALTAASAWLLEMLPQIIATITGIFEQMGQVIASFGPLVDILMAGAQQVIAFVQEGENLKSILMTLGVIVAAVVVPPFLAWAAATIAATLPLIAIGVAIFAVIKVLNDLGLMGPIVEAVTKAIGAVFNWLATNVVPALVKVFEWLATNVLPIVVKAFQVIGDVAGAVFPIVAQVIGTAFDIIGKILEVITPPLRTIAEAVFPAIGFAADLLGKGIGIAFDIISGFIEAAGKTIETVAKTIGDVWNGLVGIFEAVGGAIMSAVKGAFNFVIGIINSLIDALNGIQIHIPGVDTPFGKIAEFHWDGLGLGKLAYLAQGTRNFAGGWAMIGERGPELVNLPRGSGVLPNGVAPGAHIGTLNLNAYGVNDPKQFVQDSLLELRRELDRQGMSLG